MMNIDQQEEFARLEALYAERYDLTPGQHQLIQTLACVIIEERELQHYCNEHGTCYDLVTKSGDVMQRMRPQWQQLKEARARKQIIITRLENWLGEAKPPVDETAQFFNG